MGIISFSRQWAQLVFVRPTSTCPLVLTKRNFAEETYNCNKVRVRFAPSPTGFLHLGGLRTAFYNYLFAKQSGGSFVLRIEDTDQDRLVPNAMEQLEDDLIWAGIQPDESPRVGGNYGPYQQSLRLSLYQKEVVPLLENGSAYHCFCTESRLNLLRREALRARQNPRYDNRCRNLSQEEINKKLNAGESHCIRFKLTPFKEKMNDIILDEYEINVASIEGDPVIMKSDGFPTYHFANVVDDHYMEISHVLRGVEWMQSTTKHLLLYKALGWDPPVYGHMPLLMNKDGTKISKRQNDLTVKSLRERGFYPLTLLNLVSHSGGGFKDLPPKSSILTLDQLAAGFDINLIKSSSCQLMIHRLSEFNNLELQRRVEDETEFDLLKNEIKNKIQRTFSGNSNLQMSDEYITTILTWSLSRISNVDDLFTPNFAFLWVKPKLDLKITDVEKSDLQSLIGILENVEPYNRETLGKTLRAYNDERGLKYKKFMMSLRSVLSGLREGPSVTEMMELLGKQNTIDRIQEAIKNS